MEKNNAVALEGAISVLGALETDAGRVIKIMIKQGLRNQNTRKILAAAKEKNIEAEFFSWDEMQNFAGLYQLGKTHGGIFALVSRRVYLPLCELLAAQPKTIAVIEGIEDPYNLGYAARALYTQGTDALILPGRDFGFSESAIEKASTGTFSKMPTAVFGSKTGLTALLKSEGFRIYCIDVKAPAGTQIKVSDISGVEFADKTVYIIGGEKRGISKEFLRGADEIVKIPYAKKFPHALAAQTAATIVAYEIHRQKRGL